MADHYNMYHLKHFAATVAECMDFKLPDGYAPAISWVSDILKRKMGGAADRAVLYHADAVAQYIWQKYTNIFAPVYAHTSMAIPFLSTVKSVTPVAHASMYTGLDPEQHGITKYVRPKLECSTFYDELIREGKRPVIVAQADSSFLHIFKERKMDYFECKDGDEVLERSLEVIEKDIYDVISIHTFEYDSASHHFSPESKEALNALTLEAENFSAIVKLLETQKEKHKTVISYSPDHGQHAVEGGRGAHGSNMIEDMNILHFFGTI